MTVTSSASLLGFNVARKHNQLFANDHNVNSPLNGKEKGFEGMNVALLKIYNGRETNFYSVENRLVHVLKNMEIVTHFGSKKITL